jgi:coenzyme F420-reducing hydrogenase beta subunit
MIEIKDKKDCCGCHACAMVCVKHCITMQADEQGFLYPVVDKDACNDCSLCNKVCPVINQNKPRKPLKVYAAKNKNEEVRRQSSSGGIFTLLAEKIIAEGGVVFGARFDEEWNVIHSWVDTIEGIEAFRGSKYVQSTIGSTYREAKGFLKQGRKVLFSGTPCQIAGLKKYLCKDYDNLLTVDVVCHGVPSPLVWRTYLDEFRKKLLAERNVEKNSSHLSIDDLPVITDISFRDKRNGWKNYGFRLRYITTETLNSFPYSVIKNETEILHPSKTNVFMKGFLADLYLRPSCHACTARMGKSYSDISIADFWGVKDYYPEFDDDKGVGLILLYTDKGISVFSALDALYLEATYEQGLRGNLCLEHSAMQTNYSMIFWTNFARKKLECVHQLYNKKTSILTKRLFNKIKKILNI